MGRLKGRLDLAVRRLPQPSGVQRVLDAELRALSDDEVRTRFARRMAEWDRSPEGMALAAELAALSDEELVARWESLPRFRDVPRGRRGC